MAEETAKPSVKKETPKKIGRPNKWIIGLLLLVLVLGGLSFYQMKRNKELKAELAQKKQTSKKTDDIKDRNLTTDSVDPKKDFSTVSEPIN